MPMCADVVLWLKETRIPIGHGLPGQSQHAFLGSFFTYLDEPDFKEHKARRKSFLNLILRFSHY